MPKQDFQFTISHDDFVKFKNGTQCANCKLSVVGLLGISDSAIKHGEFMFCSEVCLEEFLDKAQNE